MPLRITLEEMEEDVAEVRRAAATAYVAPQAVNLAAVTREVLAVRQINIYDDILESRSQQEAAGDGGGGGAAAGSDYVDDATVKLRRAAAVAVLRSLRGGPGSDLHDDDALQAYESTDTGEGGSAESAAPHVQEQDDLISRDAGCGRRLQEKSKKNDTGAPRILPLLFILITFHTLSPAAAATPKRRWRCCGLVRAASLVGGTTSTTHALTRSHIDTITHTRARTHSVDCSSHPISDHAEDNQTPLSVCMRSDALPLELAGCCNI